MANEIHIKEFLSKEELFTSCSEAILIDVNKTIVQNKKCKILLSGGSTPEPLYKLLSENKELVSKVIWGLVDERFIDTSSDYSNEKMIKSALGKDASVVGMVADNLDYETNLMQINEQYKPFTEKTNITILGMGTDGHFASLFPGDKSSEEILNSSEKAIFNTSAPSFPEKRITCSFQLILESETVYLIITGKSKKEILKRTEHNLPIHKLLAKRNDIKIYYAD